MLVSLESAEGCDLCGATPGWYFYRNRTTRKTEIRNCPDCRVFDDDEQAAKAAISIIQNSLDLTNTLTQVRETDASIKQSTARAYNELQGFQPRSRSG